MAIDEPDPQTRSENKSGTVLVIDDEPHLVGMYAAMLEDHYRVRTATNGTDALIHLSDEIDVVLLDRRMPDFSGGEILEIIRQEEYDCRVAMVTSVDPDTEVVNMPFDAYVVKPVRQCDLRELVAGLLLCAQSNRTIQEIFALSAKLAALESQYSEERLDNHDKYKELRDRKECLEMQNQEQLAEMSEWGKEHLIFRDVLTEVQSK